MSRQQGIARFLCFTLFGLTCGSCGSPTQRAHKVPVEMQSPELATAKVPADPKADLVFLGTVKRIDIALGESRWEHHLPFQVIASIDKVESGSCQDSEFFFRIHSPTQSGLQVGKRYRIAAHKTDQGYVVDPDQWRRPGR